MFLLVIEGDESFDNFDSSEAVIYIYTTAMPN